MVIREWHFGQPVYYTMLFMSRLKKKTEKNIKTYFHMMPGLALGHTLKRG